MSMRLQVLFDAEEYERVREDARRHGMTVSSWVRQSLRDARRRDADGDIDTKLQAIERAVGLDHPTGDIDEMLEQIESGRNLP